MQSVDSKMRIYCSYIPSAPYQILLIRLYRDNGMAGKNGYDAEHETYLKFECNFCVILRGWQVSKNPMFTQSVV